MARFATIGMIQRQTKPISSQVLAHPITIALRCQNVYHLRELAVYLDIADNLSLTRDQLIRELLASMEGKIREKYLPQTDEDFEKKFKSSRI